MKVNVQSLNFNADQKLIDFIQEKLDKLETYYDRVIAAEVYLKTQTTGEPENKISEILLRIPGDDIIAQRTKKTFEEGIDEVIAALRRQLQKRKEKTSVRA
ncbi:MAG TPA: ribosome-associated translation inhibitor RaiA [Flavobacteriaceae bacterium]|nr:ribosome-associated translation inhibitor RaiA [Flavobacteriaceae bacterium]